MSAVSAYSAGAGLKFSGQSDEQGIDTEMSGCSQGQYYVPYLQGKRLDGDFIYFARLQFVACIDDFTECTIFYSTNISLRGRFSNYSSARIF
jgi:hypothetical protein